MTEKLQVKVIIRNIVVNRINTGEYILEALEWIGISYREIWRGWSIHLFFTSPCIKKNLFYKYVPQQNKVKKLHKHNMDIFSLRKLANNPCGNTGTFQHVQCWVNTLKPSIRCQSCTKPPKDICVFLYEHCLGHQLYTHCYNPVWSKKN